MYTLEEIKKDIAEGKCNAIYYSANTLWWTHLDSDLEQATKMGSEKAINQLNAFINDPTVPENKKGLAKMVLAREHRPPMDPTGSVLFIITEKKDIDNWITVAENKPEHFGKHGLKAFVMSHHKNCNCQCYQKWQQYNDMIDEQTTLY